MPSDFCSLFFITAATSLLRLVSHMSVFVSYIGIIYATAIIRKYETACLLRKLCAQHNPNLRQEDASSFCPPGNINLRTILICVRFFVIFGDFSFVQLKDTDQHS